MHQPGSESIEGSATGPGPADQPPPPPRRNPLQFRPVRAGWLDVNQQELCILVLALFLATVLVIGLINMQNYSDGPSSHPATSSADVPTLRPRSFTNRLDVAKQQEQIQSTQSPLSERSEPFLSNWQVWVLGVALPVNFLVGICCMMLLGGKRKFEHTAAMLPSNV